MNNVLQFRRKSPLATDEDEIKYSFCLDTVRQYFAEIGKPQLEKIWWTTPNPALGNLTPTTLSIWNLDKLYKFLLHAKSSWPPK